MFSIIKMKPESSGIFLAKMVSKNIFLGSPVTHFMNMSVKEYCYKRKSIIVKNVDQTSITNLITELFI